MYFWKDRVGVGKTRNWKTGKIGVMSVLVKLGKGLFHARKTVFSPTETDVG